MFGLLRITLVIFHETMERKTVERWVKDGHVPRDVLSWMLLALFFTYGRIRMDELTMDGIVRVNNFCRESLVQRNLDCKGNWHCVCNNWHVINNRNNINCNRRRWNAQF